MMGRCLYAERWLACHLLMICSYKDQNGWSLTKVVLIETKAGVELRYPPFDIAVTRS